MPPRKPKRKRPCKSTWKGAERRLAEFFGTKRRPGSGSFGDGSDDALHPDLYIESKHALRYRAVWSLYLDTVAKAQIEGKGRLPVIGLFSKHQKGFLLVIHSDRLHEITRHATTRAARRYPKPLPKMENMYRLPSRRLPKKRRTT